MDGRPAAFLEVESVEWVASYDGTPIERVGSGPSGAEAEILEQLDALVRRSARALRDDGDDPYALPETSV